MCLHSTGINLFSGVLDYRFFAPFPRNFVNWYFLLKILAQSTKCILKIRQYNFKRMQTYPRDQLGRFAPLLSSFF